MKKTIVLIFVTFLVLVSIASAGTYIHSGNVRNCLNATSTTFDDVGSRNQDLSVTGTPAYHSSSPYCEEPCYYLSDGNYFSAANYINLTKEENICILMRAMTNISNLGFPYWIGNLTDADRSMFYRLGDASGNVDFVVNDVIAANIFGHNLKNLDSYVSGINNTNRMNFWWNKTRYTEQAYTEFTDNYIFTIRLGANQVGSNLIGFIDGTVVIMNVSCDQDIVDEWVDDKETCDEILEGAADTTPPHIILANCTSCNPPEGDSSSPYTTEDTTPTFVITTNENAYCAIADIDANYTAMINGNAGRDCSGGGTQQLTCTLQPSDAILINETDYVYIACKDTSDNENTTSTSGALEMAITSGQVEIIGENAIMAGINTSTIWPDVTVHSNQQIYIRDIEDNQILATFDKLAVSGNQRWAFNYLKYTDSFISGLFNITPAFYAEEYQERTYQDVNDSVRTLIDSTN